MQKNEMDKALFGTGLGVMDMANTDTDGGVLCQRCIVPPFSVLSTRDGVWQDRKRAWLALGLQSELGRAGKMTYGIPEVLADGTKARIQVNGDDKGTSIFDAVLCELAYLWWTAPGQVILDPFAGGSVRGIVASVMGRFYMGHELRDEQVTANIEQAKALKAKHGALLKSRPQWFAGDSLVTLPRNTTPADFVFSCPPYGNLEVYSDDPADISNKTHDEFLTLYRAIIQAACARLADNRFAAFVVANYRPKEGKGRMTDFVGDTIRAFEDAGLQFYNDCILVNNVGSGAMRANTNFVRGHRKVVKMHQNLLVFVKGCPKVAAAQLPDLTNMELS